ncbi:MAG: OmpA family protein [Desulfobacterales bacterium]|nr:OmpA family protein [Desulfobacterales bacterium]
MGKQNDQPPVIVQEGAPDWVVTFGDLMSLLLCFFVLLLSFSEMDKSVYKEVAGSLEKAFGVQRKDKVLDSPKGLKMIAKDFDQAIVPPRPSQEFIVTQEKKQIGEELQKVIESSFKDIQDLVDINVSEEQIAISLMGESTFDSGKAQIKPQMKPLLEKIAAALSGTDGEIIIAGHTDNIPLSGGRYRSNLGLSTARASSVAEYMLGRGKIKPDRLATMGFGEFRPVESNRTARGRQKNRRVEIIVGFFPMPE